MLHGVHIPIELRQVVETLEDGTIVDESSPCSDP
jgi:hypothetical protein